MMTANIDDESDLAEEVASEQVALVPTETADPASIIEAKILQDIRDRYEVFR